MTTYILSEFSSFIIALLTLITGEFKGGEISFVTVSTGKEKYCDLETTLHEPGKRSKIYCGLATSCAAYA